VTTSEDRAAAEPDYIAFGRCRSGKRWFWYASARAFGHDRPHCDDPACSPGLTGHDYGWEDTERAALDAMRAAATRQAGKPHGGGIGRPTWAAEILKQINATRRRARPPKRETAEAAPVEYLYEPWSWYDDYGETHKGINEIPIVKKTTKRIYYDNTSRWDRHDGVVTLGFIDRQDFEGDTRCKGICPVDATVTRCTEHRLAYPHCAHVYAFTGRWKARYEAHRETCPGQCLLDIAAVECGRHGYTWEHCPHGHRPGDCWHGTPAGVARLPYRNEHHGGGTVYASRDAAEDYLYRREREQERKRKEREPELRRLRMVMADAHPDRGGTNEEFIAARERYQRALRQAS
jgi:hypothetical protein